MKIVQAVEKDKYMTSFTGKEISEITKGELLADFNGGDFCIDSRLVKEGDIFLALPGSNIDGHNFIAEALEKGASGVIAKFRPDNVDTNSPLVIVKNVKEALLELAKHKRDTTQARFIAVTGSVGKTSTKEMLQLALSHHGETFASFGNYNNDLGVPICMASIPSGTHYVILEAGMNNPGEIAYLSKLIKPDLAIITTIEPVHLWTFENVAAIAREKASIIDFAAEGAVAIINSASREFLELKSYIDKKHVKTISIGLGLDAEILDREVIAGELHLRARIFDKFINYKLAHCAQQQIINSLFALIVSYKLGLDLEESAAAIYQFKPLKGRGEVTRLASGQILIDDSYNANPASLGAALENLASYKGRKLAIVADMLELGQDTKKLHQELYKEDLFKDFAGVVAIGEMMKYFYDMLPARLKMGYFKNYEELPKNIAKMTRTYDVILVKGSKGTKLYNIIELLKE